MAAPSDITRLAWRTGRSVLKVVRVRRSAGDTKGALPLTTPRTSLNAAITPHRKVAFATVSLDEVKELKNALGTTVNDVILALCTGALRRYLKDRDELPEDPLVATVPVSVHPRCHQRRGANKVSAMFVSLPCGVDDPLEQRRDNPIGDEGGEKRAQRSRGRRTAQLGRARHAHRLLRRRPHLYEVASGRPPPAHPEPGDLQRARA